jgi:EAL domain-containing protein (putative c-di-GMP-specific phosphodiesterase class I)
VPPSDFIPVAEHTGVIHALSAWVVANSCDTMRRWADLGLMPHMGLNLSPVQLDRPGLADDIHAELRRTGIGEERVLLELTESAWTLERPQLDALRAAGLRLAMDDFGTGQSSLGRLADLPVSVVKIDRSLMTGVPERPAASAVLRAAVQVADAVGCDLVVEGIETEAQREHLRELGVKLGQGFLMARPLAEPDATALLRERLAPERRVPVIAEP